jgi:Protein of unknown function, DUF547
MISRRTLFCGALAAPVLGLGRSARAAGDWTTTWEAVLRSYVDAQGRVDFDGIRADPAALRNVVDAIAVVAPFNNPDLFPTEPARIAYWINAYNALSMWGVVQWGVPQRFDLIDRWRFFIRTKRPVAGHAISLDALETDVIRPIGEERVHFALNCMVRDCPRLPREPFRPERLEVQLTAAAREFCTEGRTVRPDPVHETVWLSAIFHFYTGDFVPKKAPNLISYVNRWRVSPLPQDWQVRFLDYDWTINRQPPRTG